MAFRWRSLGALSVSRVAAAGALLTLVPVARAVDAVVTVGLVSAVLWAMLVFEGARHADARHVVRHGDRPGDHAR